MFTISYGDRPGAPDVAILITDGVSDDQRSAFDAAVQARAAGISIVVIEIGPHTNPADLERISSFPASMNDVTLSSYNQLSGIVGLVKSYICDG